MLSRPPYFLLGNGEVAVAFLSSMIERDHPPLAVVLNAVGRQREADAIREACSARDVPVLMWSDETRSWLIETACSTKGSWLVSVYFGHIIDEAVLGAFDERAINLHAALLPWCRGVHTNVWPIVDRVPAGVTLHAMSRSVDGGAILFQREVDVYPWDTAESLYRRLCAVAIELLCDKWPEGVLRAWPGQPQSGRGSVHRLADFTTLDSFEMPAEGAVREFYDLLRARSFPPHPGLKLRFGNAVAEATIQLRWIENEADTNR